MTNNESHSDVRLETDLPTDSAPAELTAVVDELLNQLSTKFSTISGEMLAKMDDMSRRLDNLEATIQARETRRKAEQSK